MLFSTQHLTRDTNATPRRQTRKSKELQWKNVVNVPSSENTHSGQVQMVRQGPISFGLRCTVPACRYKESVQGYVNAQRRAFQHAGQHQFRPRPQQMAL